MDREKRLLRLFVFCAVLIPVCLVLVAVSEALYVWKDKNGVTQITDYPDPSKAEKLTEELIYRGPDRPAAKVTPKAEPPAEPPPVDPVRMKRPPIVAKPQSAAPRPEVAPRRPGAPSPSATMPHKTGRPVPPAMPEELQETPLQAPGMTPAQRKQMEEAFRGIPKMPPGMAPEDQTAAAGLRAVFVGLLGGFLLIVVFISLAAWIFFSLCLFLIAKKLDIENPWIAWIPLVQTYTFVLCAGKPWWWLLMFWLGFVVFPVGIVVSVILWMAICENLGVNKWLGLLVLVPLVNVGFAGYLAFSKNVGPQYDEVVSLDSAPPPDELPPLPD